MTSADTPSPKSTTPMASRIDGPDPSSGTIPGTSAMRMYGYADSLARRQRMLGAVLWGLLLLVLICT